MNKNLKIKNEILEKISKMENNTFLFPLSWSDKVQMKDHDWSYKLYNSGSKGTNRYHNIEIYSKNEKLIEINFRGNKIQTIQDLSEKIIRINDVYFYVSAIYDEMHSFENHDEGKRKIRVEIEEAYSNIKKIEDSIIVLKRRLIDSKIK